MTQPVPVNAAPRPRVLLQDVPDEWVERLTEYFPSVRRVTANDEVHEDEFDVLITTSTRWMTAPHLHVVSIGLAPPIDILGANHQHPRFGGRTLARELTVPPDLPGEISYLVKRDMVPLFADLDEHEYVVLDYPGGAFYNEPTELGPGLIDPFLTVGNGHVLAGRYTAAAADDQRPGGRVWLLPDGLPDPVRWIALAIRDFHEHDPDRVPSTGPTWWDLDRWSTPDQLTARSQLTQAEDERAAALEALDTAVSDAQRHVEEEAEKARAGILRLLTSDGDELEIAVKEVFRAFGFDVRDMDAVYPDGDRREDLQVTLPDGSIGTVLVEIKGYTGGARVNDLARLERWSARFSADTGALPNAKWHVVNSDRLSAPDDRPRAIPNDDDLAEFAPNHGVLIDSRDLFETWKRVESGVLTAEAVRASLTASPVRWVPPTP